MYDHLSSSVEKCRQQGLIPVIVGDMNGHIEEQRFCGLVGSYRHWNTNGRMLVEFISGNHLSAGNIAQNTQRQWTWQRGGSKGILDYVLIPAEEKERLIGMKIHDEGDVNFPSELSSTQWQIEESCNAATPP